MSFNYNIRAKIKLFDGKTVTRTNYVDEFNNLIKFSDWKTVIVLKSEKLGEEVNLSAFIKLPEEQIFVNSIEYIVDLYIPVLKENPDIIKENEKFEIRENGIIGEGEILKISD